MSRTGPSTSSTAASQISNAPAGNIAATTVQAAIDELDSEKSSKAVINTFTAKQRFEDIAAEEECHTVADNLASGDNNFDILTARIWEWTTAGDTNATLNIRGDGSTSLDSLMAVGKFMTVVAILTHTGTAYYVNALKIDGSSVTPKFPDGTAISAGSINAQDHYIITIKKTADATFTVYMQKQKWDEA